MTNPRLANSRIAIIVGSNRRASINRALAIALTKLAPQFDFTIAGIDDLPIYGQDIEAPLPPAVARFKDEIAAADGLIVVTPEHNRSIPAVLKNAIDWAPALMGKTPGLTNRFSSPAPPPARSQQRSASIISDTCSACWARSCLAAKPTSRSSPT